MTTRIVKTERFIPTTGSPVFQITEEVTINGQVIRLDPRNPTPEELDDAVDQFAAAQQARVIELETEVELLRNPPFDPRYISPDAWFARMSLDNVARLFSLSEQQSQSGAIAKQFIGAFTVVKAANRPMWLDHPDAQAGVAFLVTQGVFSTEDAARMLADSREDEQ